MCVVEAVLLLQNHLHLAATWDWWQCMLQWDDFHSNTSYGFATGPLFSRNGLFGMYTSFLSCLFSWLTLMRSLALQQKTMQGEPKSKVIASVAEFWKTHQETPLPPIFQLQRSTGSLFRPLKHVYLDSHQKLMLQLPSRRSTHVRRRFLKHISRKPLVVAPQTPGGTVYNVQMNSMCMNWQSKWSCELFMAWSFPLNNQTQSLKGICFTMILMKKCKYIYYLSVLVCPWLPETPPITQRSHSDTQPLALSQCSVQWPWPNQMVASNIYY